MNGNWTVKIIGKDAVVFQDDEQIYVIPDAGKWAQDDHSEFQAALRTLVASYHAEATSLATVRSETDRLRTRILRLNHHLHAVHYDLRVPQTKTSPSAPPATASWLYVLFADKKTVECQLGDMAEIHANNVVRYGEREARWMYWRQVVWAVKPAFWRVIKGAIWAYIRGKIGL